MPVNIKSGVSPWHKIPPKKWTLKLIYLAYHQKVVKHLDLSPNEVQRWFHQHRSYLQSFLHMFKRAVGGRKVTYGPTWTIRRPVLYILASKMLIQEYKNFKVFLPLNLWNSSLLHVIVISILWSCCNELGTLKKW